MAPLGDVAQCLGRDVAGQNQRRDLVHQRLSQARDNLQTVQTPRQIVVDDRCQAYRTARTIPAPWSVGDGDRAVTVPASRRASISRTDGSSSTISIPRPEV